MTASPAITKAKQTTAVRTEMDSDSPAAATISGEGVSPAASAAATARALGGRWRGSSSRQRAITRSTAGSMSLTSVETLGGAVRRESSKARLPVNIS